MTKIAQFQKMQKKIWWYSKCMQKQSPFYWWRFGYILVNHQGSARHSRTLMIATIRNNNPKSLFVLSSRFWLSCSNHHSFRATSRANFRVFEKGFWKMLQFWIFGFRKNAVFLVQHCGLNGPNIRVESHFHSDLNERKLSTDNWCF